MLPVVNELRVGDDLLIPTHPVVEGVVVENVDHDVCFGCGVGDGGCGSWGDPYGEDADEGDRVGDECFDGFEEGPPLGLGDTGSVLLEDEESGGGHHGDQVVAGFPGCPPAFEPFGVTLASRFDVDESFPSVEAGFAELEDGISVDAHFEFGG